MYFSLGITAADALAELAERRQESRERLADPERRETMDAARNTRLQETAAARAAQTDLQAQRQAELDRLKGSGASILPLAIGGVALVVLILWMKRKQ